MARRAREAKLETRSARPKLPVAKKPVFVKIGPRVGLGYRRNQTAGTWVLRVADGKGGNWTKAIGFRGRFRRGRRQQYSRFLAGTGSRPSDCPRRPNGDRVTENPSRCSEHLTAMKADLKITWWRCRAMSLVSDYTFARHWRIRRLRY